MHGREPRPSPLPVVSRSVCVGQLVVCGISVDFIGVAVKARREDTEAIEEHLRTEVQKVPRIVGRPGDRGRLLMREGPEVRLLPTCEKGPVFVGRNAGCEPSLSKQR